MKTNILKLMLLLSALFNSVNVMAHGDHAIISPDHGLEHVAYYGIGIVAALLVLNIGRKMLQQNKNK